MTTFSVYVHVPWCKRRCPYCNFYLVVGRPEAAFVDALIKEWRHRRGFYAGIAKTLYFGGGTPSLLHVDELKRFIDVLGDDGILSPDAEITLEANPEDLTENYAGALVKTPINRVSLGVQSFDDGILRKLGRKHTGQGAKDAIARLMDHGLTNISVDQIVGVPAENVEIIIEGLNYLNCAGVRHVSSYLLTIEEGTRFHRNHVSPSDDAQADIYQLVQRELLRLGYDQYDISSFAKDGFLSRHNQAYWAAQDYVGLGPGAHSMRRLATGGIERAHNHAEIETWLLNPVIERNWTHEALSAEEALREALAFGLRNMHAGMEPERLAALFGASLPLSFSGVMAKYKELGWLAKRGHAYVITQAGALFADAIMRDILSS